VLSAQDYYPYGEILKRSLSITPQENKYLFQGKERDWDTGLDYVEARYFDPAIGMFRQVDPLWEKMLDINPYHYTHNDPMNRIDPDGTRDLKDYETKKVINALKEADLKYIRLSIKNKLYYNKHGFSNPEIEKQISNLNIDVGISGYEENQESLNFLEQIWEVAKSFLSIGLKGSGSNDMGFCEGEFGERIEVMILNKKNSENNNNVMKISIIKINGNRVLLYQYYNKKGKNTQIGIVRKFTKEQWDNYLKWVNKQKEKIENEEKNKNRESEGEE
jgi:RHS repeat-associated protein